MRQNPALLKLIWLAMMAETALETLPKSLNFIDIATSWDVTVACKNKAQVNVFEAIKTASERFPFRIAGIDLR